LSEPRRLTQQRCRACRELFDSLHNHLTTTVCGPIAEVIVSEKVAQLRARVRANQFIDAFTGAPPIEDDP